MEKLIKKTDSRFGFFAFIALGALFVLTSQKTAEPKISNFTILVETPENGIKLTCKEGCAFKELFFSSIPFKAQAVNQFGTTKVGDEVEFKDDKIADFLFVVEKSSSGLTFKGLRGTAWTELSFSCPDGNCSQWIDQNGTVVKD